MYDKALRNLNLQETNRFHSKLVSTGSTNTLAYCGVLTLRIRNVFIVQALEQLLNSIPLDAISTRSLAFFQTGDFSSREAPIPGKGSSYRLFANPFFERLSLQLAWLAIELASGGSTEVELGNTKGESITVPLTSCLTGLD